MVLDTREAHKASRAAITAVSEAPQSGEEEERDVAERAKARNVIIARIWKAQAGREWGCSL